MSLTIVSPNTVLANALMHTIDILRPRIAYAKPEKVKFVVGTQINGLPHIGTHMTQCAAFLLAEQVRNRFKIDTSILFGALDNAPHDVMLDPESHHAYQITYQHKLGKRHIDNLIHKYYLNFFNILSERTFVDYEIQTYSEQQSSPEFRLEFIKTLEELEMIRWFVSPSSGIPHIRFPCPQCRWAEKRSERTNLIGHNKKEAKFNSYCFDHMEYSSIVSVDSDCYLDLNTIYRNIVKESCLINDKKNLYVIVKGGDWVFACQQIDWALGLLGHTPNNLPVRVFTPQILTDTGAKLSKSLIKRGAMEINDDLESWLIDPDCWDRSEEEYAGLLIWTIEKLMSDPKHFYRSYSYKELQRIMKHHMSQPSKTIPIRTIRIYKKYFKLIEKGVKTIEIRVGYSSMKKIKPGQLLKFICQDDKCLTKVNRVTEYTSFKELLDSEDINKINPHVSYEEQLKELSNIFPSNREALGVLCIELQKVNK